LPRSASAFSVGRFASARLLTGDDLIALGFTPGKIIGEILQSLEDEQLEGRITTQEEANKYVQANWKMKQ